MKIPRLLRGNKVTVEPPAAALDSIASNYNSVSDFDVDYIAQARIK